MKPHISLLTFVLAFCFLCSSQVKGNTSLPSIIQESAKDGKLTLVVFGSESCHPCQVSKDIIQNDTDVQQELSYAYNIVFLDQKRDQQWFVSYGVTMMPTMMVINSSGKRVAYVDHYLKRNELISFLQSPKIASNMVKVHALSKPAPLAPLRVATQDLKESFAQQSVAVGLVSLYEIQVGSFSSLASAKQFASRVSSQYKLTAFVTQSQESQLFVVSVGRTDESKQVSQSLSTVQEHTELADAFILSTQMPLSVSTETYVARY